MAEMKKLKTILEEITQLTNTIETNYPELYKHLNENPMTIPKNSNPDVDKEAMEKYLESLKQLIKHHVETHKKA